MHTFTHADTYIYLHCTPLPKHTFTQADFDPHAHPYPPLPLNVPHEYAHFPDSDYFTISQNTNPCSTQHLMVQEPQHRHPRRSWNRQSLRAGSQIF